MNYKSILHTLDTTLYAKKVLKGQEQFCNSTETYAGMIVHPLATTMLLAESTGLLRHLNCG